MLTPPTPPTPSNPIPPTSSLPSDAQRVEIHTRITEVEFVPPTAQKTDALDDPSKRPEILAREDKLPDGMPAQVGESRIIPPMIIAMGILGVAAVGFGMLIADGPMAALAGIAWVLLGYAVAWIVVWGAGLMRAKEEQDIVKDIEDRDQRADRFRDDRVHLGGMGGKGGPLHPA